MNKLLRFISNAILYLFIGSMLMVCSECVYLGVKYVENGPMCKGYDCYNSRTYNSEYCYWCEKRMRRFSSSSSKKSYSTGSKKYQSSGSSYTPSYGYYGSYESYDDGYEDVYENEDYDFDRYYSDPDYADGVDDAMDELDW